MTYTSDKRLYLEDGKVVEEVQVSGTLLVGAGGELPDEVAARHGLTKKARAKAEEAPPATKQVAGPPSTKARKATTAAPATEQVAAAPATEQE